MPCVRNLERLTQRKPVAGRPTRRRAMQGFGLGQARLSQNVWFPVSLQPQRVCLSECTNVSRLVLHWGNPPIVAFGGVLALCVGMGHVSPPGTLYKCRVKTTSASVDRLPKDGKGEREGGGGGARLRACIQFVKAARGHQDRPEPQNRRSPNPQQTGPRSRRCVNPTLVEQ